jgi:hypothetical protein
MTVIERVVGRWYLSSNLDEIHAYDRAQWCAHLVRYGPSQLHFFVVIIVVVYEVLEMSRELARRRLARHRNGEPAASSSSSVTGPGNRSSTRMARCEMLTVSSVKVTIAVVVAAAAADDDMSS